jgi:nucleoside-diphosphate-sugar epimerase
MTDWPGRVLVTGAGGRLGRRVVPLLRAHGIAVTALDRTEAGEADRWVVSGAAEPEAVDDAVAGVDAVVHLAAIPAPNMGTAEEVFIGNTAATFTVLERAARAGVRRAVIASSYSVTGLPFAPVARYPTYLPMDESIPLQVEDPYALSKQVDEATAAMMWWRHGLSTVALRFPFLGDAENSLPARAEKLAATPEDGVRELWSYLDFRDAARVCLDALRVSETGCHVVALAAPQTLCPYATEALLDAFLPAVPRRTTFPGRTAPFDLTRARALLRFDPTHLWPLQQRDLP